MNQPAAETGRQEGRAADVQRTRIGGFALASLAVHLVAVILVSVLFTRPERPVFADPIYSVALVDWPEPNFEPPKPARKAPQVEEKKPEPPAPKPEPIVEPEAVPVKPVVRPEPKKPLPEKKPEPVKPPEKKPEPKKDAPVVATPPPDDVKAPPAEEAVSISLGVADNKDLKQNWYKEQMRARLARAWVRPRVGSGLTRVTIHFVVQRDGTIVQPYVQETSGIDVFDRSAMSAVLSVGRLAPLPQDYSEEDWPVNVVFQSREGAP